MATVGGQHQSEMEEVQLQIDQKSDETLESTRRMVGLCGETEEVGVQTLITLDEQGEQLDRIEKGMDDIDGNVRNIEKILPGMESCCGINWLKNPFKKKNLTTDDSVWKDSKDVVVSSQPQQLLHGRNGLQTGGGGAIEKITNDAREDEMDKNMDQVSLMVGNLRNIAIDMGTELDIQNNQISRIDTKAESNKIRLKNADDRTAALLEKA